MPQHEPLSVLLAVKPGLLRNALQNLLRSMQSFDVISMTGDLPASLDAVENQCPAVVLVDVVLIQSGLDIAEEIIETTQMNGGHCIILTQNARQKRLIEERGTVQAVVWGTRPRKLVEIIETAMGESNRYRRSHRFDASSDHFA